MAHTPAVDAVGRNDGTAAGVGAPFDTYSRIPAAEGRARPIYLHSRPTRQSGRSRRAHRVRRAWANLAAGTRAPRPLRFPMSMNDFLLAPSVMPRWLQVVYTGLTSPLHQESILGRSRCSRAGLRVGAAALKGRARARQWT